MRQKSKKTKFGNQLKEAKKALRISSRRFKNRVTKNKQIRVSEEAFQELKIRAVLKKKKFADYADTVLRTAFKLDGK